MIQDNRPLKSDKATLQKQKQDLNPDSKKKQPPIVYERKWTTDSELIMKAPEAGESYPT